MGGSLAFGEAEYLGRREVHHSGHRVGFRCDQDMPGAQQVRGDDVGRAPSRVMGVHDGIAARRCVKDGLGIAKVVAVGDVERLHDPTGSLERWSGSTPDPS